MDWSYCSTGHFLFYSFCSFIFLAQLTFVILSFYLPSYPCRLAHFRSSDGTSSLPSILPHVCATILMLLCFIRHRILHRQLRNMLFFLNDLSWILIVYFSSSSYIIWNLLLKFHLLLCIAAFIILCILVWLLIVILILARGNAFDLYYQSFYGFNFLWYTCLS